MCSHSELADWYAPGAEPVIFDIDGIRFGTALCIEVQFPEVFIEYARRGVDCMLFSAYSDDPMYGIQAQAQAHAATNNFWLSLSIPALIGNRLSSGMIGPDGHYLSQPLANGAPGLVCSAIDRADARFDVAIRKARPWRASARSGEIYAEKRVDDVQSKNRTSFFAAGGSLGSQK